MGVCLSVWSDAAICVVLRMEETVSGALLGQMGYSEYELMECVCVGCVVCSCGNGCRM